MKRNLMLMTLLVISSLMIAPALAQTLTRTQDQQTRTTSPVYVAAADETPSTVVATEEAGSSKKAVVRNKDTKRKMVVIGNKDTKRYHLSGMPGYNKVKKNHRIYFNSERQAIANGYYKAGTGKDLTGSVSPADGETMPESVAAADEAPSTVIVPEEAGSSKKVVIGNKDTKRYHLSGMPYYSKVKKNHRIYFDSEEQAIANGYYKAGTGNDLTDRVSPAGGKTIKNQSTLIAVDSAESEKSSPEALQKNEKILETKAQDTPKIVEEPQKLSGENIQKETVKKETVTDQEKDINQKLENLQKQVDTLRDLGRTREKITIGTTEDKTEQEKAILTAAGREYTMMQQGRIEMQYSLLYSYVSSSEILSATNIVARVNNTITNAIDVQYGLLKNIATGIHVPYVYLYDKSGSATAKDTTDMGDISLNLSYQPFKSGGDWPTTTITMGATLPTGRSPYEIDITTDLPTGGGLYGFSLGVNMSKPIDPAMAFGSISCSYSLERDGLSQYNNGGAMLEDIKPGMSFNASVGLGYAISYALSMNVSFQYGYVMSTEYRFSNSNAVVTSPAYSSGTLSVGIGYRVSPLTTLSLGLSIGLTNNDPDFSFSFRVPFNF